MFILCLSHKVQLTQHKSKIWYKIFVFFFYFCLHIVYIMFKYFMSYIYSLLCESFKRQAKQLSFIWHGLNSSKQHSFRVYKLLQDEKWYGTTTQKLKKSKRECKKCSKIVVQAVGYLFYLLHTNFVCLPISCHFGKQD